MPGSSSRSKKNCVLANGDDSDATIVDDDKKSEDVDTEFCDEDAVNGVVNHTDHDSDDDMGDDDDRDNDYRPSQYLKNFSKASSRGLFIKFFLIRVWAKFKVILLLR